MLAVALALTASVANAESSVTYTVAPGDRLVDIADRLGVSPRELVLANSLADAELLRPGQALIVPGADDDRPSTSTRGTRTENEARPLAWLWPTVGRITTHFGVRGNLWKLGYHPGLDIAAPTGTPIIAAAEGVVIEAGWHDGYGNYVKLDHGNGLHTLYGHMSRIHAEVGETVALGGRLGLVGSTGCSTGPHLHLEVRVDGQIQDPLHFLP